MRKRRNERVGLNVRGEIGGWENLMGKRREEIE